MNSVNLKPLHVTNWEVPSLERAEPGDATNSTDGFGQALASAVQKVDQAQVDADGQAQRLGGGEGNLHETMLALEKADVAMRLAMKVRTKLVDAYNEVMRMSV
jgi:flagellar hook-basal body complex protein FliE